MSFVTIFLMLTLSLFSFAVPERDFPALYETTILPFFDGLDSGFIKNAQGMNLKYYELKKASHKKALIILPGRTEPAKKYAEVLFDLRNKGLDLYIMDHQGQGESDRPLEDTQKGHVIHFMNYVKDLEQFVQEIVLREKKDLYILAHSMGAAISVHLLARNPELIKKAVLVAPMLQVNTKPYSEVIARYYSQVLVLARKGTEYAPGRKPWSPIPFEGNDYSHSEVRFSMEKYLFTTFPELALGGPTARWVSESLKGTKDIDKLPVKTPVLLFQAGQDNIVMPARQNSFCKNSFCEKVVFPEARHEILMEKDSIRNEAFRQIESFLGF